MNCETFADNLTELAAGRIAEAERHACDAHARSCASCREALEGALALRSLASMDTPAPPDDLFTRVVSAVQPYPDRRSLRQRFWLGAGFGGAVAASLLAVAITLGVLDPPQTGDPAVAEFVVARNEPRPMNIAIDADRPLPGATISILLSGGVQIDGYGDRRELTWNEDLAQGINKLTLPVLATGSDGGQMIVRLSHPDSEQVFVVRVRLDG